MNANLQSRITFVLMCVIAFSLCLGMPEHVTSAQETAHEEEETQSESAGFTQWLRELYESAKSSGEKVPGDMMQWAKDDVSRIGAWEYHIATFTNEPEEELLAELQRLGAERWECFWVEHMPTGKRFYFKKSERSMIRTMGGISTYIPLAGGSSQ